MSNENEKQEPTSKKKAGRIYEVLGTLNLGRKKGEDFPDVRTAGASVTEEELSAGGVTADEIRGLIAKREIADPDAPIAPSEAEGHAALDALADVAQKVGALVRRGARYQIGDDSFRGVVEFRNGVSIDRLKAAIVAKFKE